MERTLDHKLEKAEWPYRGKWYMLVIVIGGFKFVYFGIPWLFNWNPDLTFFMLSFLMLSGLAWSVSRLIVAVRVLISFKEMRKQEARVSKLITENVFS